MQWNQGSATAISFIFDAAAMFDGLVKKTHFDPEMSALADRIILGGRLEPGSFACNPGR